MTSCSYGSWCVHESAKLLIVGYNRFAEENGKAPIELDGLGFRPKDRVEQFLNDWVVLARSKALAARGKALEARDEAISLLSANDQ
jgi:hypothetical protein